MDCAWLVCGVAPISMAANRATMSTMQRLADHRRHACKACLDAAFVLPSALRERQTAAALRIDVRRDRRENVLGREHALDQVRTHADDKPDFAVLAPRDQ